MFLTICWIIATLVVLSAVGFVLFRRHQSRQRAARTEREYQYLCALVDQAEQGDQTALQAVTGKAEGLREDTRDRSNTWVRKAQVWGDRGLAERIEALTDKHEAELDYQKGLLDLRQHVTSFRRATKDSIKFKAIKNIAWQWSNRKAATIARYEKEFGLSSQQIIEHATSLRQALYDAYFAEMPSNEFAVTQLHYLIRESHEETPALLSEQGFSPLAYPKDWNDLVARYVWNPSLDKFIGLDQPLSTGDLRVMAAVALGGEGNLTEAQIVLAYCNNQPRYREELGGVFTFELGLYVERKKRHHVGVDPGLEAQ